MSDDNLNEKAITAEEEKLLALLDGAEADPGEIDRETLETVGLLAYGLDDAAPSAVAKDKLMAEISAGTAPMPLASVESLPSQRLNALERRARWSMPIAAAFAIALLGVAALQFRQLSEQRQTIEELSAQLERVEQSGVELASVRNLLAQRDGYLRMLTTKGAEFCLLKPVGAQPRLPTASATMVISPERNKWYLAAEGLAPCDDGSCYVLWFVTDAEPIRGPSFDCNGGRIELTGEHEGLPLTIRAITITMATEADEIEPETVLLADQAMTLL